MIVPAKSFFVRIEVFECAFQLFQLLPSFAELAFRRQALVVGQIFRGFRDECVAIRGMFGCSLGTAGQRLGGSSCRAYRGWGSAKECCHRRLEGWSVCETVLQCKYYQTQLRHGAALGLQVNRFGI